MPNRWDALCELVREDDSLPTRAARQWTEDKLWFWNRYIEITTTSMRDNAAWKGGLVYVDLFAGPGVLRLKSGRRIPGSPLIAASAPHPFRKILLCEKHAKLANACLQRLNNTPAGSRCQMFVGDCNDLVDKIAQQIPPGALTLAFIDPTGLHANFETIRRLSQGRSVDLLILFADAYDIVRNIERYENRISSNLDRTLGSTCQWRPALRKLTDLSRPSLRKLFTRLYRDQLEKELSYTHFESKSFESFDPPIPLYQIIYASRHPLGLKFWKEALKKTPSGQKEMW